MTVRTYATPAAFKQALEQRLRASTRGGPAFARRRQLLVFDRFLARIVLMLDEAVTLKGGLALEFRLERARTTKDIDLLVSGSPDEILMKLQAAARRDLGDFMVFEVRRDAGHPEIQNDGVQYDGLRFRAECSLAGRPYGQPFGVDVAFGDPFLGQPQPVVAADHLGFAGVTPPTLQLYPIETHIAEKLHAYTMPRPTRNSRVKDLPDMSLLATVERIDARLLRQALELTFQFRKTHPIPSRLPDPPVEWSAPYEAMAITEELAWGTLKDITHATGTFLDPVLSGELDATWAPDEWRWVVR